MVRIGVIGYMMLGFSMRFPVIAPRTIPRTLQKKAVFAGRALDRGNGQLVLLGQGHGFLEGQRCDSPGENVQEVASPFFCAKKTKLRLIGLAYFFYKNPRVNPGSTVNAWLDIEPWLPDQLCIQSRNAVQLFRTFQNYRFISFHSALFRPRFNYSCLIL